MLGIGAESSHVTHSIHVKRFSAFEPLDLTENTLDCLVMILMARRRESLTTPIKLGLLLHGDSCHDSGIILVIVLCSWLDCGVYNPCEDNFTRLRLTSGTEVIFSLSGSCEG